MFVLAGCGDDEHRPPIVWEGEYLRFGTDEALSMVCTGTLPYADAYVRHLGEVFGRPDPMVDYYWIPDSPCGSSTAVGCISARTHDVFSMRPLHLHELVHAVRGSYLAYLPLEEGIAELWGDDSRWQRDPSPGDVLHVLRHHEHGRKFEENWYWYPTVGHFASYLHATGGTSELVEMGARSEYSDSFASMETVFEQVYGISLEASVADYIETYPVCDQTFSRDTQFDCMRNVVHLPGDAEEPLGLEMSLACGAPEVLGTESGARWMYVTLDVPVTAYYRVTILRDDQAVDSDAVRVRRCGASCFDEWRVAPTFDDGGIGSEHCLDEGRYLLRLAAGEGDVGQFSIEFEYSRMSAHCS